MYLNQMPRLLGEEHLMEAHISILGNSASYRKEGVERMMRDFGRAAEGPQRRRAPRLTPAMMAEMGITYERVEAP